MSLINKTEFFENLSTYNIYNINDIYNIIKNIIYEIINHSSYKKNLFNSCNIVNNNIVNNNIVNNNVNNNVINNTVINNNIVNNNVNSIKKIIDDNLYNNKINDVSDTNLNDQILGYMDDFNNFTKSNNISINQDYQTFKKIYQTISKLSAKLNKELNNIKYEVFYRTGYDILHYLYSFMCNNFLYENGK